MWKDINSLSHTKWNCKYHIVFAPKYRRKEFYGDNRLEIGKILRELCKWKGVNIITAEVCPNHVLLLVEIPQKMGISSFMGFLKGKSSVTIYERWGNMKFKYRNRQFWCRGYYVDTASKNAEMIRNYIDEQLKEDHLAEQSTIDKINPFTGSKNSAASASCGYAFKRCRNVNLIGIREKTPVLLVDIFFNKTNHKIIIKNVLYFKIITLLIKKYTILYRFKYTICIVNNNKRYVI